MEPRVLALPCSAARHMQVSTALQGNGIPALGFKRGKRKLKTYCAIPGVGPATEPACPLVGTSVHGVPATSPAKAQWLTNRSYTACQHAHEHTVVVCVRCFFEVCSCAGVGVRDSKRFLSSRSMPHNSAAHINSATTTYACISSTIRLLSL